jgi:hypothetical protein
MRVKNLTLLEDRPAFKDGRVFHRRGRCALHRRRRFLILSLLQVPESIRFRYDDGGRNFNGFFVPVLISCPTMAITQ